MQNLVTKILRLRERKLAQRRELHRLMANLTDSTLLDRMAKG